jgi:hypothetical protein
MYRSIIAFLLGYKPTCDCQEGNPRLKKYFDQLIEGGFPKYRLNDLGTYIFFRTEEARDRFAEEMKHVKPRSVEYVRKLGHVFGFPPKSIDFFAKHWKSDKRPAGRIGIDCSGYVFISHVDILFEEVSYLWKQLEGTTGERFPTVAEDEERREYIIPFGDHDKLKEVSDRLRKAITV